MGADFFQFSSIAHDKADMWAHSERENSKKTFAQKFWHLTHAIKWPLLYHKDGALPYGTIWRLDDDGQYAECLIAPVWMTPGFMPGLAGAKKYGTMSRHLISWERRFEPLTKETLSPTPFPLTHLGMHNPNWLVCGQWALTGWYSINATLTSW